MQRKIFVGIDLQPGARSYLSKKIAKYKDLPIRWNSEKNYHITLVFLGYIDDERCVDVCNAVEKTCENIDIFDIFLNTIKLGPDETDPKMLLVTGVESEPLKELQAKIEQALDIFVNDKRSFRPHITLGRIRKNKWENHNNTPEINEKIGMPISVECVTVFESTQESGQREYLPLEVCPLKY